MTAPIPRTVDVIKRIRDKTTYFKKVSGIADINRMMNQQTINQTDMPFAGVLVPMTTASENENMPGYMAYETTTYQVVVVLDMTTDDTGYQAASDAFDLARADLKGCLMGWDICPERSNGYPMSFSGGSMVSSLDSSNSRAVYHGTVRNFVCEALFTLLIRRWRVRSVHRREWRTGPLP
ncbi:phage tail terminator protein, partial [Gluconacetobacter tumulicola]